MAMRAAIRSSEHRRRHGQAGAIGVDLGTSTSSVYAPGRGVVIEEPSIVATDTATGAIAAVGQAAEQLAARASGRFALRRPLRRGVIVDGEAAAALLRHLLRASARRPRLSGPRVAVSVPGDADDGERRAVVHALRRAGARAVALVDEPMAAAIGAGVAVAEARPAMVVDIGGGITEVAVVAMGGVVARSSARVGGDDVDAAIAAHLRRRHGILIGPTAAEELKRAIGSAHEGTDGNRAARLDGTSGQGGPSLTTSVSAAEIRRAVLPTVERIGAVVEQALARTPVEQAADVVNGELVLTGGGSLLRGLDAHLHAQTGMPVRVAPTPQRAVAVGAGRCLCHFEVFAEAAAP